MSECLVHDNTRSLPVQFEIKSRATPSHQEISLNEARRYVGMNTLMQVGDLLFLTRGRTGTKFKSYKNYTSNFTQISLPDNWAFWQPASKAERFKETCC